jgi:hypothetical protein
VHESSLNRRHDSQPNDT